MRVITFSRYFQKGHIRQGEPTFFAEKLMAAFAELYGYKENAKIHDNFTDWDWYEYYNAIPKWHTIRAGKRWKVGDVFSPRVWTGKPYCSPQQAIWNTGIEVKKTFDFHVDELGVISIDGSYYFPNEPDNELCGYKKLATNDGLSQMDFHDWIIQPCFKKGVAFDGQIISWNPDVEYESDNQNISNE